ncbi:hypothetical protein HU200_023317 [Digitaria exilis]|uniref:Cytochrome P450 n=1 Tax=Digitaria exilis TaxID=1010633 RepID=A0A835EWS5_9POAL|nr:hypothetical protein HU200_023317 [Digitaria exilis]CAB3495814.1 unnamed protein product [Digitaria exilis]
MAMMEARVAAAKVDRGGYGEDLLGLMLEAWSQERRQAGSARKTRIPPASARTHSGRRKSGRRSSENSPVMWPPTPTFTWFYSRHWLYPPIVYIQRTATTDAVLGGIRVPRGTAISIPIGMLHRDREVWGPDADEFNPMRFEHGATKAARDPTALLSFSLGPRVCAGQRLSITEAQIVMAMILSKFSFSLSPAYVHKPKSVVFLTPKSGMPLVLRNLDG